MTREKAFIVSSGTLRPDKMRLWDIPWHTHTHKHRCTLMCWPGVCCDRHGGAGCRSFCLALTSMSLAEMRRDTGPHQYLNSLTSLPAHICWPFLLSTLTFPACLLSVYLFTFYLSSSCHQVTLMLCQFLFFGLYIRNCVIYSHFILCSVSACVGICHRVLPAVPDYLV